MSEGKHICVICRHKTAKWQRSGKGPYTCYDGCYSTTGIDRRTTTGKPLWLKEGI